MNAPKFSSRNLVFYFFYPYSLCILYNSIVLNILLKDIHICLKPGLLHRTLNSLSNSQLIFPLQVLNSKIGSFHKTSPSHEMKTFFHDSNYPINFSLCWYIDNEPLTNTHQPGWYLFVSLHLLEDCKCSKSCCPMTGF